MQRKQIKNYIASPLNYIGGKARILDQLLPHFPHNIDIFVDLFCGGCNVGLNVSAGRIVYNDTSSELIGLLRTFKRMNNDTIIRRINSVIEDFKLSRTRESCFAAFGGNSNLGVSKYNREKYLALRQYFNDYKKKGCQHYVLLYTLIIFGFNNQIRFNDKGEFNLPVGKRDFNEVLEAKFRKFFDALRTQNCRFYTKDFRYFRFNSLTKRSLVYCDPPYLITNATYNEKEGWNAQDESDLLSVLDNLNVRKIKFALSNVLSHEGKENSILKEWIDRNHYNVHKIDMDYHYSNYQKKSKKADSQEVLITNY
ncbi:MAG: Dam family site-specific DNA-(adenine-N6)-methyltransferase [Bacteroidales bacterium]|nr:Dam family site-specific DNA-(adenine-N6)-methyltransferase [Bacteroidales bacterium]